ncbi:MAG TPA: V4R domain-containing protein [Candidatus Thermoplasmatota archaeon]|nr:V4R domain-containing protein [Candidatus Thermoplasmatota archaeon]
MSGGAPAPGAARGRLYIAATATAAAAALLASALAVASEGVSAWMAPPVSLLFLALCLAGVLTLQRSAIAFEVAGERLTISIEECLVFLMLLALSPGTTPLVVFAATVVGQVASRRRAEKVLFNVATGTVAAAAGAGLYAWLTQARGVDPLFAAFPALAAYSLGSSLVVAGLFSRLEKAAFLPIFARRFLLPATIQIGVGTSAGVTLYGLWLHHPLATVAVIPFGLLARSYVGLAADANRKLVVHRQLADVGQALAGSRDLDGIAQRVLTTCGDVLQPGRATLVLADREGNAHRWTRDFEGGPALNRPEIEVELPGKDGAPMGSLAVHAAQRNSARFGDAERDLLRIVGSQAAISLRNAYALRELAELKDLNHEILENVPAGVLRLDGSGRVTQANGFMAGILGEGREAVGAPLGDLPFAAAEPRIVAHATAMLGGVAFYDLEVTLPDGRAFSIAGVPLPASERNGEPGGVLMLTDITARRLAEEAARRQTLTRPFVRRIVLEIVGSAGATRHSIAEVGRRLSAEVRGRDVAEYAAAFREMGLGDLRIQKVEGDSYTFTADDLLERRAKSSQPTCHLALGYMEGAVASLHARGSLGTEVRCQSQGHERCTFVVKPREIMTPRPRARPPTST